MEVRSIQTVLQFAKAELDNCRESYDGPAIDDAEKSIDDVEMWLTEIGALPSR